MIHASMPTLRTLAVACLAATIVFAAPARSAPQPNPIPQRWQLDFTPGPLRVTWVDTPQTGPRAYAYMTYAVANYSGDDLLFAPSFTMMTNEGEMLRAGQDVPASVTQELLRRLENPLLLDQIRILGVLLQGEENTRQGLVVWPLNDLDLDEIAVYASGFSGETDQVELTDPSTGETHRLLFRKTYELRYAVPGDLNPNRTRPLDLKGRPGWVMR